MAFFDSLAAKLPAGGSPRQPEVAGAPPTPSAPRTTTPPAVNAGPAGRPPRPSPSFPGGLGAPLPVAASPAAPVTPTPQPSRETLRPGQRPAPVAPATAPASPGETKPPAPAGPTAAMPGASSATGYSIQLDRVPSRSELMDLPEGVTVQTPYGSVDREGNLNLSPEGKMAYQEQVQRQRQRFGPHPLANIPGVQPVPIQLGKPMFNVWTGQWQDRPAGWGRQ